MCGKSKEEYAKVPTFKCVKQMYDTLAIVYKSFKEVKYN